MRYPNLQFDPAPPELTGTFEQNGKSLAFTLTGATSPQPLKLRAFQPNSSANFAAEGSGWTGEVVFENVSLDAQLNIGPNVSIERDGLKLLLSLKLGKNEESFIQIKTPTSNENKFAVIGNLSNLGELAWYLKRTNELNVQFAIILGGLAKNHEQVSTVLTQAKIPSYFSISANDYQRNGNDFIKEFGPANLHFDFAGLNFIFLDTAIDTFPAGAGERSKLLKNLTANESSAPSIILSAKSLRASPQLSFNSPLNACRETEADWVMEQINQLNLHSWICSAATTSADYMAGDIHTYISGEGGGEKNGRVLLGTFRNGQTPDFHWEQLNMPADAQEWESAQPPAIKWWPTKS